MQNFQSIWLGKEADLRQRVSALFCDPVHENIPRSVDENVSEDGSSSDVGVHPTSHVDAKPDVDTRTPDVYVPDSVIADVTATRTGSSGRLRSLRVWSVDAVLAAAGHAELTRTQSSSSSCPAHVSHDEPTESVMSSENQTRPDSESAFPSKTLKPQPPDSLPPKHLVGVTTPTPPDTMPPKHLVGVKSPTPPDSMPPKHLVSVKKPKEPDSLPPKHVVMAARDAIFFKAAGMVVPPVKPVIDVEAPATPYSKATGKKTALRHSPMGPPPPPKERPPRKPAPSKARPNLGLLPKTCQPTAK